MDKAPNFETLCLATLPAWTSVVYKESTHTRGYQKVRTTRLMRCQNQYFLAMLTIFVENMKQQMF